MFFLCDFNIFWFHFIVSIKNNKFPGIYGSAISIKYAVESFLDPINHKAYVLAATGAQRL